MRRFRDIIESPFPVPSDSLWIKGNTLKAFTNGKWTTIGGVDTETSKGLLEVDITEDQFINILNGKSEVINIKEVTSDYDVIALKVDNHSYFLSRTIQTNGTASYSTETITVKEGSPIINQIQAIVSPGVVSFSAKFIGLAPEIVSLEIGDSEEVKAHNLKELKNGFFFTQLDYGYGVGTWQSSTGGFAHVTTAYGNEVFYNIDVDGAITKNEDYIKPNEPYTIQLGADQIGTSLDAITASHILKCGEIIIDGSTGPVTYTRSVDSTASAIYFTSSKKDDTLQVLTYTVANKTITASVASQKYTLPAATKTALGGVKAGTSIAALTEDADLATVVGTVNSILTQLKTAGVLI